MVSNSKTIESLISRDDSKKLSTPYDGSSASKKLAAKEFHHKVINREIQLDKRQYPISKNCLKHLIFKTII